MIITLVIDPEAFNKEGFTKLHSQNALELFRSLENNALMLVDIQNIMREQLKEKIKALPQQLINKVQKKLKAALINKKIRIVPCLDFNPIKCTDFLSLHKQIKNNVNENRLDAIISNTKSQKKLCSIGAIDNSVIPLEDYIESNIREKQNDYSQSSDRLDILPLNKVNELISRVLWYGKTLSFFDGIIGKAIVVKEVNSSFIIDEKKSSKNLKKWYDFISDIIELWENNCHFENDKKFIEIFTCELELYKPSNIEWPDFNKKQEPIRSEARKLIEENLIYPLNEKFKWSNNKIKLHIKRDIEKKFHCRYLQINQTILNIGRGFDIYKPRQYKKFRCTDISIKPKMASLLQEIRKLEEVGLNNQNSKIS